MINIGNQIFISESEIAISFIRSPGPGGQNVNKVATAVLLRFNVTHSLSIPDEIRARIITLLGNKLTQSGDILIKATRYRTQNRNKQDALERLTALLAQGVTPPKKRKKTKPTYSSTQKRLSTKKLHSKNKSLRSSKPRNDS
jgi:ribosome-associated protein